jgi:signal transduction histidine kinase
MNARKYSFPGGDVEASMVNDGKTLTITVTDHGFIKRKRNEKKKKK